MSIAAHFRRVPDALRADAETRVERCRAVSRQRPGAALRGQLVLEFLPNVHWDKGEATRWIVRDVEERFGKPAWVVFVGDDVTDGMHSRPLNAVSACASGAARRRRIAPARQHP